MWWGKSSDDKNPKASTAPVAPGTTTTTAPGAPPTTDNPALASSDPNKLPERRKLSPALQKIVDQQDKDDAYWDDFYDGYAPETTESNVRFAAYAARARTILSTAHRYVAYTSDIGESFRPVAHPWLVRSAYGISWAYIIGDVSNEGYKAYKANQRTLNPSLELTQKQEKAAGLPTVTHDASKPGDEASVVPPGKVSPLEDWRTVLAQRAIFQSVASMGLPAFTIHSVVRYSGQALKGAKNKTIRTWGPIGLGLAVVPFLPTLFDEPVESATEWIFHKGFETFGGKEFVGDAPKTGREKALVKPKEKEL
ncbi:unnamed protein product [Discula destructiva]